MNPRPLSTVELEALRARWTTPPLDGMIDHDVHRLLATLDAMAPSVPKPSRTGRQTWLTPFVDDWRERFGGDPNYGQLARALAPLHKQYPLDTLRHSWRNYLARATADHVSVTRFAQTFRDWTDLVPRSTLSLDDTTVHRKRPRGEGP